MAPLTPWVQLALAALVVLTGSAGLFFYRRQNVRRALGGRISRAKAAWLVFAILFWLGVCPILAFESRMPDPWRTALGVFALNFWVRGLVELWMLYVSKNWRPPYGIAHDAFSVVLVVVAVALSPKAWEGSPWDWMGLAATATLLLSLVAETYYAIVFHALVAGRTTGDDGVWFADQEDPKFVRVNRVTAVINVPLYGFLGVLLAAAWGAFA